jgi:hypothetical protein
VELYHPFGEGASENPKQMKAALLFFIIIHGLLHLLGFAKAFEIYNAKQLILPISKPAGIIWLLAFLFCLTAAILLALNNPNWWLFALISVCVSQLLIILYWQDAKFGTIANVVIIMASIIGYGTWHYFQQYKNDVEHCMYQEGNVQSNLLSETDIAQLPEPVKKYIRYAGCIGKAKVHNFKIAFKGKIRKNEGSEWMPFTSEQYNFIETPTRLFFMNATMKKLPVAGYHCYINGTAFMDIRLFSLFKVQYQNGPEMNTAETVTFFNDMCCMAPATLIDKRINWLGTDNNKVKATFTNNGITITADLFFNEIGQLVNFKSNDRYDADAHKKLPWATPLKQYHEINGYKLASYAETIYTYPDKELCYGVFGIQSIEYNCTKFN